MLDAIFAYQVSAGLCEANVLYEWLITTIMLSSHPHTIGDENPADNDVRTSAVERTVCTELNRDSTKYNLI